MTESPLIVQADGAVLLETQHPAYEDARARLATFAALEKSPEFVHFYRITPISVWNAAALGERADEVLRWLEENARFPIAKQVTERIAEWYPDASFHEIDFDSPGPIMMADPERELPHH